MFVDLRSAWDRKPFLPVDDLPAKQKRNSVGEFVAVNLLLTLLATNATPVFVQRPPLYPAVQSQKTAVIDVPVQNLLLSLMPPAVAASPFYQTDWDVPRARKFQPLDDTQLNRLLGLTAVPFRPVEFPPNFRKSSVPDENRSSVLTGLLAVPFRPLDVPGQSHKSAVPDENRPSVLTGLLAVPFRPLDVPGQSHKSAVPDENRQSLLTGLLAVPFRPVDFQPQSHKSVVSDENRSSVLTGLMAVPFRPVDSQVVFSRGRVSDHTPTNLLNTLLAPQAVTLPFNLMDWSVVRHASQNLSNDVPNLLTSTLTPVVPPAEELRLYWVYRKVGGHY